MIKILVFYLLLNLFFLFSSPLFARVADSEIKVLVGQDYLSTASALIKTARQSIFLKMYLFTLDSGSQILAEELVEAKRRGVEVEVILDKEGERDHKNEKAYTYLKENGLKVSYDEPATDDNVMTLTEDSYYPFLAKAFKEAGTSIHILMYSVERGPEIFSLVQELARARERGVKIEIMLDQSFRDNLPEGKNVGGVNLLREYGLAVKFDSVARLTQAMLAE